MAAGRFTPRAPIWRHIRGLTQVRPPLQLPSVYSIIIISAEESITLDLKWKDDYEVPVLTLSKHLTNSLWYRGRITGFIALCIQQTLLIEFVSQQPIQETSMAFKSIFPIASINHFWKITLPPCAICVKDGVKLAPCPPDLRTKQQGNI